MSSQGLKRTSFPLAYNKWNLQRKKKKKKDSLVGFTMWETGS